VKRAPRTWFAGGTSKSEKGGSNFQKKGIKKGTLKGTLIPGCRRGVSSEGGMYLPKGPKKQMGNERGNKRRGGVLNGGGDGKTKGKECLM